MEKRREVTHICQYTNTLASEDTRSQGNGDIGNVLNYYR